jgi:ribose transport system ATP-binding protein
LLKLSGLEKRFGATAALAGVDLEVRAGEVHALIGENGAGKSTLMNVLSGAFPPDRGEMGLAGERYAPEGPADARRLGIAHIHQDLSLCPHLSVAENILLGAEPSAFGWLRRDRLRQRAAHLLEEFGRGEIDPRSRAGALSLPDQQVVEICRALAWNSRVLLMDEPTSTLPRSDVERLFRLVRQLRDRGLAIVYISHFLEEVREIAQRYTVLRDGRSVGSGDLDSIGDDGLISLMVGRPVESALGREPQPRATGEVVLEVTDLAAAPRLVAASFDLRRGEILGIAGLVGSGRTDLIRALFGLARITGGRVRLRGKTLALGKSRSSVQIRNGFGFLSEDRKREGVALALSIADNVTMSRFSTCARAGWIDRRRQREQARSVMRALAIRASGPAVAVRTLSGGNQQKVAFGRLLHQDPDLLLLDEPARGIDVASRSDIYAEIGRLTREGKSALIVSSYLPELFGVCDRIAVMNRGRLSPSRPVSEWTPESVLQAATAGTAS